MDEKPIHPINETKEPNSDAQKSEDKPPVAPVDVSKVDESKVDAKKNTRTSDANKNKRKRKPLTCFELCMVILSSLGILIAGGTGAAVGWQAWIGARTLNEIHTEQRAWVVAYYRDSEIRRHTLNNPQNLSYWKDMKFNWINMLTENGGHTPAIHAYGESKLCIGKNSIVPPNPSQCGLPTQIPSPTETILPGMKLPWYWPLDDTVVDEIDGKGKKIDKEMMARIDRGERGLFIVGFYNYSLPDMSETTYTAICLQYQGPTQHDPNWANCRWATADCQHSNSKDNPLCELAQSEAKKLPN